MIRGDWRWAHKRSIIPPSDRRRYRPTRWSKSTKGEQTQKRHNRSVNGHNGLAYDFTCEKKNDGGGQSASSALISFDSFAQIGKRDTRRNSVISNPEIYLSDIREYR